MHSHLEQKHAKVKACAWEGLSRSNEEDGLRVVRLEATSRGPMSYHETRELRAAGRLEGQFRAEEFQRTSGDRGDDSKVTPRELGVACARFSRASACVPVCVVSMGKGSQYLWDRVGICTGVGSGRMAG